MISGFRPATAIGGGCIIANLQYSDALVPIRRLSRMFTSASIVFVVIGIALSFVVSHAIAKPIARLAASARAMQEGRFEQPTGVGGPTEVRQLAHAFSSMARSIGDLVQRPIAARCSHACKAAFGRTQGQLFGMAGALRRAKVRTTAQTAQGRPLDRGPAMNRGARGMDAER